MGMLLTIHQSFPDVLDAGTVNTDGFVFFRKALIPT
jgi:hypothetical protein